MTAPTTTLGEIVFFAEVLGDPQAYNSSLVFRDGVPLAWLGGSGVSTSAGFLETGTMTPDDNSFDFLVSSSPATFTAGHFGSSTVEPGFRAPFLNGYHCLNLNQRSATLALHRNIAAWVAVSLAAIGIIGNIFSLFVLFRTQPRSPTDVYMMHLAAYDVAYEIFFALVISSRTWWSASMRATFSFVFISLVCRPLIDLFSNLAAVVVTVFAMERLLAVYRPLKILNSSSNKRVLWIALATATLITLPDFFEFGMTSFDVLTSPPDATVAPTTLSVTLSNGGFNSSTVYSIPIAALSNLTQFLSANGTISDDYSSTEYFDDISPSTQSVFLNSSQNSSFLGLSPTVPSFSPSVAAPTTIYCYYRTQFAQSEFYNAYVYFYTVVFTFIPLFLLILANGFLIWGVARASKNRRSLITGQHTMKHQPSSASSTAGPVIQQRLVQLRMSRMASANGNSESTKQDTDSSSKKRASRQPQYQTSSANSLAKLAKHQQTDQQRLTLMLVMIVLIFTVCQLPIAILAIYSLLNEMSNMGVLVIYSNILVIVFSSTNFAFYSAFSRRFRQTLTEMINHLKKDVRARSERRGTDEGGNSRSTYSSFLTHVGHSFISHIERRWTLRATRTQSDSGCNSQQESGLRPKGRKSLGSFDTTAGSPRLIADPYKNNQDNDEPEEKRPMLMDSAELTTVSEENLTAPNDEAKTRKARKEITLEFGGDDGKNIPVDL